MRAADVFKPQPTPPPTYYLKDHPRVVYNESDWPIAYDEAEANMEEGRNGSGHENTARSAGMMVRAQPLGLLSVRLGEYSRKEKFASNGSENGNISKEGRLASPGMLSVPFIQPLLTLVAKQSTPVAKADISQGAPSILKYNKLLAESNVKTPTRKPLVATNGNTNEGKKSKFVSKPSAHRVQFVLTHAKEGKENLSFVSSGSDDEIDDPLQATRRQPAEKNRDKGQVQEHVQLLDDNDTFPDPFGRQRETKKATAGEPDKAKGVITSNPEPAPIITADPTGVCDAKTLKPCLSAANAPPKDRAVSLKDPFIKLHYYHHPDPNNIWSRGGLPIRITREFFNVFPTNLSPLTRNLQSNSSSELQD